ncbi:MAG: efflux transporter outer membrane subunit [Betaproteobacteria bacterium]|nr:efflux transporter outer membrane subunit [Betaproteobacteria bacterium]
MNDVQPRGDRRRSLAALASALALAGCVTVGPDYAAPAQNPPAQWHAPLTGGLDPAGADAATLATWWRRFGDGGLDRLVEGAVAANRDLQQARARVREARARRGLAQADLYPGASASAGVTRSGSNAPASPTALTRSGTLYSAGFDASWELDIFGGGRRATEAAQAELEGAEAELRDVLVTLCAEVAGNYVGLRTQQARLATAEANLEAQIQTWQLAKDRHELGAATRLAADQALYNLESTRAQIPPLKGAIEQSRARLAVLLGAAPGTLAAELAAVAPIPVTPERVAVGIPAEALRQRPDVRAQERRLAAQTARIGVATADLYPKLSLLGSIGLEALAPGRLFTSQAITRQIGASGGWTLFDAGRVRSNIAVQTALQEQALAAYESTLLKALEEVENALVAYAREQERRDALRAAVDAARRAADLARERYAAGITDFQAVLDAQRSLLTLEDQLAASTGQVATNLVSLYKALGGGWVPGPEAAAAPAP